jgi:tRNA threonylcarbamoyladenosine biosynthesis protein TsaB
VTVLGFDTATPATVAAVLRLDGAEFESRHDPAPGERPGHAQRLLDLVERVLAESGTGWEDVTRLAVGTGPGTFTGLRIGIATARALAQARDLPLVGVGTLRALAAAAAADPRYAAHEVVLAVVDARRGEAFAAAYDRAGTELLAPRALGPDRLAPAVAQVPPGALAVGDGAVRFRAALEEAGAAIPADGSELHRVSARHLCRLAAGAEPPERDAVLPDYVRAPDASPRPRR